MRMFFTAIDGHQVELCNGLRRYNEYKTRMNETVVEDSLVDYIFGAHFVV